MLKNLISTVIFGIVLLILYNELWKTPDVAIDRIHEVREQAVLLARDGEYDEALIQLENLLKLAPDNKLLWGDYLVVLIQSGQSTLAIKLSKEKNLKSIPGYALQELFVAALQLNDSDFAKMLAKSEINQSQEPVNIAINRATQFYDAGYSNQANELLSTIQPLNDEDALNLAVTRIILLEYSDPDLAQQEAQKLLLKDNIDRIELWEIYRDHWVQQARQGKLQEAILQLGNIAERAPPELNLAADLLVLQSWDAQYDKAEVLFDQISSQEGLPAYVREAGALILYKRGRLVEAQDIYTQLLSEEPANAEYKKGLAKVYVELQQPYEALALLQPSSRPVDNDTLIIIGLAQQQAGRYEDALRSLSTAIHVDPKEDDATYFAWADSLEKTAKQNNTNYVWPRFAVPLDKAPTSVATRVRNLLAGDSTILAYRASRNKNAFNLQNTRRKAAVARQQGKTDEAIVLYQRAINRAANDRELQLGLALSYIDLGNKARSTELLTQLREQHPTDREILDASVYHAQKFSQDKPLSNYLKQLILLTKGAEQEQYITTWLNLVESSNAYPDSEDKIAELNILSHLANNDIAIARTKYLFAEQRCEQAYKAVKTLSENDMSSRQLELAAYIARSCKHTDEALALYSEGIRRFPGRVVFVTGSLLVLTDMQAYDRADRLVVKYSSHYKDEPDFVLAHAYLRFSQEDYASSLALYEKVLDVNAGHKEAYVGWVLSQAELEQTNVAFEKAHTRPDLFSNGEWKKLYELRSGQFLRAAEAAPVDSRVATAQQSIIANDRELEFLEQYFPDDDVSKRNAVLNQVRAYTLADQAEQAVTIYESLDLDKQQIPVWGLMNAADAYLHARQPEEAIVLANQGLQEDSTNLNLYAILFYAQLDSENYKAADVTRNIMQDVIKGKEVDQGRVHWVARLDALFEAYQNRLNLAEEKLDALQLQAPDDQQVAMTRATIYRWRGWPNKALQTLDDIPEDAVDSVALDAAKANALLDRQSYTEAEGLISSLVDKHFYHRDVENISERWRVHNLRQYTAEVFFGESSGNTFGNEELTFEQRLYSSPINNHFRTYARHRHEYAQFPEGNGYLNRVGVGGEYRSKSFDINAEVNASTRDSTDPGITVSGVWRHGDHWSFSGEAQTFSRLVPLRGNNDDVEGKSVVVGARYRWNETHDASISAGFGDFDDGNQRKFLFIRNQHGVYQSAHHQLSLSQEFYTSENDDVEAFYFNPERDQSIRIAAIYDGVIWRRYTRKWTHRLTLGVGNYNQRGEGSAGIWDLAYLHHWQIDPTLEFKYGYIHRRRSYDGDPESFNAGIASLNWRF